MQSSKRFAAAPMSRAFLIITWICTLLLLALPIALAIYYRKDYVTYVAVASSLIWLLCLGFFMREVLLDRQHIIIKQFFFRRRLKVSRTAKAEIYKFEKIFTLRVFGIGGLFGNYGWYWNKKLGLYRAFVTNEHALVLLTLDHRKVLISPTNPAHFVEAFETFARRSP